MSGNTAKYEPYCMLEDDDIEGQNWACFESEVHGRRTVSGWITEDDVVFFTDVEPEFCPVSGKPLEKG